MSGVNTQLPDLTRKMCDRHLGIGADGVEWLFPASDADVHARLLNADGSEAEISGNGTRCVAAYICSEQNKEKIIVRTGAGLKTCTLTARSETVYEFETAMGEPKVDDELLIKLTHSEVRGIPVSMGNPHYPIFVGDFPADWALRAAEIQNSGRFPHGVNIGMVKIGITSMSGSLNEELEKRSLQGPVRAQRLSLPFSARKLSRQCKFTRWAECR